MRSESDEEIEYRHEPARYRKGSDLTRRLFGLLGVRSARDERRGNYLSVWERLRRLRSEASDD